MKYRDFFEFKEVINEVMDSGYPYKNTFETENVPSDSGDEGMVNRFKPVQIIHFNAENIPYIWYARQSNYDEYSWTIAFGVNIKKDERGKYTLDLNLVGAKNPYKILGTVIDITNRFIELDEYDEIYRLMFTAKGENRKNLYINRIIPRIEGFQLERVSGDPTEYDISIIRNYR